MKVIYSKNIIKREESEISPKNKGPQLGRTHSSESDGRNVKKLSGFAKATTSNNEEDIKPDSVKEKSRSKDNSKLNESLSDSFIEVNELNFLSKLKKKTKPKDIQVDMASKSPTKKKIIQDDAKSDWLKQYNHYLNQLIVPWQTQLKLQVTNTDLIQPVRPAFLIIGAEDSLTASQPKESVRSPINEPVTTIRPIIVQPEATNSKIALSSMKKRNQTAPHLNLISDFGKPSRFPPKLNESKFPMKSPGNHLYSTGPSIPEEADSFKVNERSVQASNNSREGGSADSLTLPKPFLRSQGIQRLSRGVSNSHSTKGRFNVPIPERGQQSESRSDDESMNNPADFDENHQSTPLNKKFVELLKRNRTTAAPLLKDKENIFNTSKEKSPGQPVIKENSKIKETEDESKGSELLGDRLFKEFEMSDSDEG